MLKNTRITAFHAFCMTVLFLILFPKYSLADTSTIARLSKEGTAAYQAGDYTAAINAWQAGLKEAQRDGNSRHICILQYSLGMGYEQLNRYEEALDAYRQALPLIPHLNAPETEAHTFTNIGIALFHSGDYATALDAFQQAITRYRQLKRRDLEATVLNNIGNVYERQGRYQHAITAYRQALSFQQQFHDNSAQGRTLNNIGAIYWHLGQYDDALAYYELALSSKRAANDQHGEAATLNNIGVVHWKRKDYKKALNSYYQALGLRRILKDSRGQGSTLTSIGMIHAAEGRTQEAWEAFRQALSITRAIGDRLRESLTLTQLGKLYSTGGDTQQAYEAFRESVTLCTQLHAREILWEALRGLAAAEVERGQFQEAVQHYEQAIQHIEALRAEFRVSDEYWAVMEEKFDVYDEFLLLLSRLHQASPGKGYDRKAFEIFERRQGRMFLEQMGKTGARRFAGLPEAVREYEEYLEIQLENSRDDLTKTISQSSQDLRRITAREQRLASLQSQQRELYATLHIRYPAYYALRYPQPVSLHELRSDVLQANEVLLVYHVMSDRTLLWVIGSKHTQMHVLPTGERDIQQQVANMRYAMLPDWVLNPTVERFYIPVTAQDIPFEKASYTLFSTLFPQHVRPLLTQERPVYIVPTGALYGIPFEALLTRPAASLENAHFLLEDTVISYLSSASLLKILRETRAEAAHIPRHPLLAFAHPDYQSLDEQMNRTTRSLQIQAVISAFGGTVFELPETEIEARAVAALFQPPPQSHPLQLRQKASRANLFHLNAESLLDEYQYVLFSLHGLIPGQVTYVDQPALILSDDLLLMSDVFGLNLNADMVMLSACNTGRGKYQRGEGVIGLTRAFMYAGTPTTTVTLWSVESISAKDLSVGMFSHLKQGLPPAYALREIKLQMLKGQKGEQFREPFFWAPFVIFGEGFF